MKKYIQSWTNWPMLGSFCLFFIMALLARFSAQIYIMVILGAITVATLLACRLGDDFDFIGSTNGGVEYYLRSMFRSILAFTTLCLVSAFFIAFGRKEINCIQLALVFVAIAPAVSIVSIEYRLRKYWGLTAHLLTIFLSIGFSYLILIIGVPITFFISLKSIQKVGDLT